MINFFPIYFYRRSSGFSRGASAYRGVTRYAKISLVVLSFVILYASNLQLSIDITNMEDGKLG